MEISSLRPVYFSNFRDHSRNEKPPEDPAPVRVKPAPRAEDDMPPAGDIDFAALSPRQLRETAQVSFEQGLLDEGSFFTLLEGLPDQAIDVSGKVMDLSGVGDDDPFDFRSYYESQLAVAQSLGDPVSGQLLASIVAFMDRRQPRR